MVKLVFPSHNEDICCSDIEFSVVSILLHVQNPEKILNATDLE